MIADIIKYEGDNTVFIWKHPVEDFNIGTQLIVHESQEAVLYMNGQALDLFGPGRHMLDTQNMPLIQKYLSRPTGDTSPFHCEVYFINKTEQMAIKWGTDSYVEYVEPSYNFPIKIGASGEMTMRAEDARKLLVKIVGTEKNATQQAIVQKFRSFLMTRIKTYLSTLIKKQKINIFEIDQYLTSMSADLLAMLKPDFLEYGVSLEKFFVMTIVKPEEDKIYQKFKELHFRKYADVAEANIRQQVGVIDQETEAKQMVIESEGLAQKRKLEGYTYQQERGYDVAEKVAQNEGVGEFSNMGIGLGMVSGVGGTVGGAVGGIMQETMGGALKAVCPHCGKPLPQGAKFCLECGAAISPAADGAADIICPACHKRTPNGKFCMECGAALTNKCPDCGAVLLPDAKFCPQCGKKL